jgi:hypothetical protein
MARRISESDRALQERGDGAKGPILNKHGLLGLHKTLELRERRIKTWLLKRVKTLNPKFPNLKPL